MIPRLPFPRRRYEPTRTSLDGWFLSYAGVTDVVRDSNSGKVFDLSKGAYVAREIDPRNKSA